MLCGKLAGAIAVAGEHKVMRTGLLLFLLYCQHVSMDSTELPEIHTGTESRFGVDLKPLTGCMRSIGTARERSMAVGADWARSMLAARKRVDCMAAVGVAEEWRGSRVSEGCFLLCC